MEYTARYQFTRTALTSLMDRRTLTTEQRAAIAAVMSGRPSMQDCRTTANACRMYGIDCTAKATAR
jgi:hypothetical protein